MHRPVSPLLHDYKPSADKSPQKSRALQWFAVGLGIPLIGIAMVSMVDSTTSQAPPLATPVMTASAGAEVDTDELVEEPAVYTGEPLVWAPAPEYETLTLTIRSGDTLDQLFRKHKLDIGHLATIARLDAAGKQFRRIKPGDVFEITHDEGKLVSMYSPLTLTSALKIDRQESGFAAEIIDRPIEVRKKLAYGVIDTSLFESAVGAGLSDKLIMNIAGIFAWDVDFVLDIRTGDNYYVQWEEIWQEGEFVTDGEIIAAEFNNNGRTHRAIRFIDDTGRTDYYTPDGHSVRKAFIRAPVDFTRISSNFNPNRRHPILNRIRAHRGVDYAAPRGTPIKAAGDGKVIFRGVKGGYGNAVILQHGGNITTLYGHMSKFAAKAQVGRRVRQGQTIGYVGATGLATANHLHYEYRLNGVHRNPRTVKLPQADPIADKYREQFFTTSEPILQELERFKSTQLAAVAYLDK
ncbi:MAG: peptidoglycan DD-metalloendopeptidase family protein [Gammaproteobacteria bacterium]|nr:peptidoglycan DD-metalloendopeptidase family protein [Gammaproteobacteria bacterium]